MTETSKQKICAQRTDGWCESAAEAAQVTPEQSAGMQSSALLSDGRPVTAFERAPMARNQVVPRTPRPDGCGDFLFFGGFYEITY